MTGAVEAAQLAKQPQFLDSLPVERERGITGGSIILADYEEYQEGCPSAFWPDLP